jgi:hypothetical protein
MILIEEIVVVPRGCTPSSLTNLASLPLPSVRTSADLFVERSGNLNVKRLCVLKIYVGRGTDLLDRGGISWRKICAVCTKDTVRWIERVETNARVGACVLRYLAVGLGGLHIENVEVSVE